MKLLQTEWQASLPGTGHAVTSVLTNASGVFAGSHGYVIKLDPLTGDPIGSNHLHGMGEHEVRLAAPADASMLVAGSNGYVLAMVPDSVSTIWKQRLPDCGHHTVSVLCANGAVYAGCNGHVYRLNAGTGHPAATNPLKGLGGHEVRLGISADGQTLFVGINGYVLGLEAEHLHVRWHNRLPGCRSGVTSVVGGTGVGYAGCNGWVYRLDATYGSVLHQSRSAAAGEHEVRLALDGANQRLYAGSNGQGFALNADTLAGVYSVSLPGCGFAVTDVAAGNGVAFYACNGHVYQLGATGGLDAHNPLSGRGIHETRLAVDPAGGTQLICGINGWAAGLALSGYPSYDGPWMGKLAPQIGHVRLRQLAIPGTHDSGTFGITPMSDVGLDEPAILHDLEKIGLGMGAIKTIMAHWGVAQGLDFAGQLQAGIRYLDLRVQGGDTIRFVHGLAGSPVTLLIEQLGAYLAQPENDKEVVLLDFNHFYGMHPQHHGRLVAMLKTAFGDLLAPAQMGTDVTLDELWATPHRIITFYHDDPTQKDDPLLWSRDDIESPWPNVQHVEALIKALNAELPNTRSGFFVLQGVLTPNWKTIAAGLDPDSHAPDSLKSQAKDVTPQVIGWLSAGWYELGINVVICDWFNLYNFVPVVVGINLITPEARLRQALRDGEITLADVERGAAAEYRRVSPQPSPEVEEHLRALETGEADAAAPAADRVRVHSVVDDAAATAG